MDALFVSLRLRRLIRRPLSRTFPLSLALSLLGQAVEQRERSKTPPFSSHFS